MQASSAQPALSGDDLKLEPLPGPQLPTGYAGCLLLAMLPSLWFALKHSRLDELQVKIALPQ